MARVVTTRSYPVLAATVLAALAGCASTALNGDWKDPQFAGPSLRGQKVLVVCDAYEATVKRICQDRLAAEVVARGSRAEIGPDVPSGASGRSSITEQQLEAARSVGAKAILSASLAPSYEQRGTGFSIGFGLGSWGRGGGGGVGVSAPIGGGPPASGYSADSRLTDASNGRLIWTAKASAPASSDVNAQMSELAKTVVDSAQKAGLL